MKKMLFDDGFQDYLVDGAKFEGRDEIPCLMKTKGEIPSALIPFDKARTCRSKHGYLHFYVHDCRYGGILTNTRKYDDLISQFDGIITPDPTIVIGMPHCIQAASTYMNRAIGYYEQCRGINVIPNVRWGDPSTYDFCFLGIPKHSVVAISTHGAVARDKASGNLLRRYFKQGLKEMLDVLEPTDVVVRGFMPPDIFDDFKHLTRFHRFPSEFEATHKKGVK